MQIAVIGAGIAGVTTAYFLAAAGHDVAVIERHGNVAEEASFGDSGVLGPACIEPWAAPGGARHYLSTLWQREGPLLLQPTFDPALWRWLKLWRAECEPERYRQTQARLHALAAYSQQWLRQLREHHQLDYERSQGCLQLLREPQQLAHAQTQSASFQQSGLLQQIVSADIARQIESGLAAHTNLAGARYFPNDEAGNCPLFIKQLKALVQSAGVQFHFNRKVSAIVPTGNRVAIEIGEHSFSTDAVVLTSAGIANHFLQKNCDLRLPLYPVKTYAATAPIKNFEHAPSGIVIDERYRLAITRLGTRIRISGIVELGQPTLELRDKALRTLVKAGEDWFPDAANYANATFWCGWRSMLPDGAPLLGATPAANVFLNVGHGASGWALALGSGKLIADLMSETTPEIDLDGLTLPRYR